MCRSAVEYPPYGKRCGFGDHFTEAEREARRLKRNARDRELYHIRKSNKTSTPLNGKNFIAKIDEAITKAGETETKVVSTGNDFEEEYSSLRQLSMNHDRLGGGKNKLNNVNISTDESRRIAATILSEVQDNLAYMQITGEDESFSVRSTNEVSRLFLEDGSVAYFKNYDEAIYDPDTTNYYGHDVLESFNNEVVAYRLCQIIGGEYSNLVPPTVLREYNGKLGTLQTEAKGKVNMNPYDVNSASHYDKSHLRNVALFEYLAGSQDRHLGNYSTVDNGGDGKDEVVLIDNGYAFPHSESELPPFNRLELTRFAVWETAEHAIYLEPRDIEMIEKVKTSLTSGELSKLLSKHQKNYMEDRIKVLLEDKKLNLTNYIYNMGWS